jgi:hypothetical protein
MLVLTHEYQFTIFIFMSDSVLVDPQPQIEIISDTNPIPQKRKAKLTYQHIVQKPSLCGPTSLQMILQRRGAWFDQEEIAKQIGVKIAAEEVEAFSIPLPVGNGPKELGLALDAFEGSQVKQFFAKNNIVLNPKVYRRSEITNVSEFIYENLQRGNDVMADIWMAHYVEDLPMGHYCLVSAIEGDRVTICDPWPTTEKFWETSVEDLEKAMDTSHDGTERGFVVFKDQ